MRLRTVFMVITIASCAPPSLHAQSGAVLDLVILGGRVMDPETSADHVRNIGIRQGSIVAVTINALSGRDTIDARGLVVAPGFIDMHQHAQDSAAYIAMVRDGTTTALELEDGNGTVDAWYRARAGRAAVNFGVSIGHAMVRSRVFGDSAAARGVAAPTGSAAHDAATGAQLSAILAGMEQGLREGAVAVGLLLAYAPGTTPWEVLEIFRIAARYGASVHVHARQVDEPLWYLEIAEVIAAAAATGAPAHLVHINSTLQEDVPNGLELLRGARLRGVDVTTEAYPYTAGMTWIASALFDDWEQWSEAKLARHEWAATGERLTRESFARYRATGGSVAIHPADSNAAEKWVRAALADSLTMIASDGILENGSGHPRVAGTHARVLGRYVREQNVLSLMDALKRMTLDPARRLQARVPAMQRKGRISMGADADIVVFDPAVVRDNATFREPARASSGIPHVIVGGVIVVRNADIVAGALPGRAVRAPQR